MTPDQIRALVDEEIARREIAAALEPPRSRMSKLLRHPAFLLVIGFLLTTLGGALITLAIDTANQWEAERREAAKIAEERRYADALRQRDRRALAIEDVKSIVQQYDTLLYLHERLKAAVRDAELPTLPYEHRATAIAPDRMAYEKAYLTFETTRRANALTIQNFFDTGTWTIFNKVTDERLYTKFGRLDHCVTKVVGHLINAEPSDRRPGSTQYRTFDACKETFDVGACVATLGQELTATLRSGFSPGEEGWREMAVAAARRLEDACEMLPGSLVLQVE